MAAGLFLLPLMDESPTGKIIFWRNVILAGAGFGALTGAALGLRPQDASERNTPSNPADCDPPAAATDEAGDGCESNDRLARSQDI
ncbi:hypothetical protein D6833_07530 [Candidatus Parcubacteria bacterium]|nr:MAG: hypothetical protein D6833_07530 [Candidatus Parcubacteria bacterium]